MGDGNGIVEIVEMQFKIKMQTITDNKIIKSLKVKYCIANKSWLFSAVKEHISSDIVNMQIAKHCQFEEFYFIYKWEAFYRVCFRPPSVLLAHEH